MDQFRLKSYTPWLWLLLVLFAFRVIAQLSLTQFDIPLLPNYEQWHSGAMPYWLLLLSQVVILAVMLKVTLNFSRSRISPNRRSGTGLAAFGIMYLSIMLGRLILGLTVYTDSRWFTNWIPTFFHIVLASFVLVIAAFHLRHSRS